MFLGILSVVCLLYSLYHYGKLLISIARGYMALRQIEGYRYPGIKCENQSFNLMAYIVTIFLEVVVLFCICQLEDSTERMGMLWSMWIFRGLILAQIISILAHVIAVCFDKYAYLTYQGMVHIFGVMEFHKCSFTWEQSDEELSEYLLVHEEKTKKTFRFRVIEDLEKAHEMV
ncbi:MAG: hypothetical protein J6B19_02975 [Lachnospiraceae bacterium]|nr:hypothetical protein [Lachnospiraceae bacterium]